MMLCESFVSKRACVVVAFALWATLLVYLASPTLWPPLTRLGVRAEEVVDVSSVIDETAMTVAPDTSAPGVKRRQRGSTGYQPVAPPNEAPEVTLAKRAALAAKFTNRPLYPVSVAAYEHAFGTCANYRHMHEFNFTEAHAKHVLRTTGKEPRSYPSLTNMHAYYDEHLVKQARRSARAAAVVSGNDVRHEPFRRRVPNGTLTAWNIVKPVYNSTRVQNDTRLWEYVLPDQREEFASEHESCHFVMARMLAVFAAVMERLGLYSWFISHGTLLGAARHGGFIPWDVDVDIVMPRSHMTVLRKVWRKEFPRDMFLQSEKTEPSFHMWVGKERAMRIKDRYSSFLGVSFAAMKKGKRYRAKPWHLGVHLDIIPLERKGRGGSVLKIFQSYFNRSVVFPLSAICFENIILPAPNNVTEFLEIIYGPDYMALPANATFLGAATNPCLAATPSRGSQWSLNWRRDGRATGNATKGDAVNDVPTSPVLFPRGDPSGSFYDDYRNPYA